MTRAAKFSPDRAFRYMLSVTWNPAIPPVNFIMLNPSTADEVKNDPTVERCQRRAQMMGFGGVIITNLFAWRSTDPCQLYLPGDRVGPENDDIISTCAMLSGIVVCGWGVHGGLHKRGTVVKSSLVRQRIIPYYLKLSKAGFPYHPLYVGYSVLPQPWV